VKEDLSQDMLVRSGKELEHSLNRLTALADASVQDSNPAQCFFRLVSSNDANSQNDDPEDDA
jgi:hypothetical protein